MDLTISFSSEESSFQAASASSYSSSDKPFHQAFYSSVQSSLDLARSYYYFYFFYFFSFFNSATSSSDNSERASHSSGVMDLIASYSSEERSFQAASASAYSSSDKESQ